MSTWDDAVALARQYVPGVDSILGTVERAVTVRAALEQLAEAERGAERSRLELMQLTATGIATAEDFANFDVVRGNLFNAQTNFYVLIVSALGRVSDALASEIPVPLMMPPVARPRHLARRRSNVSVEALKSFPQRGSAGRLVATGTAAASMSGLGAPPAAVAAIVGNPWFWAAAVLIILAGIASVAVLGFLMSEAVRELARVFTVRAQTVQLTEFYRARNEAYQSCVQAGGTTADCAAVVGLVVPTPEESLPALPDDPYRWIVWTTVVLGAGAGLWIFLRSEPGKALTARMAKGLLGVGRGPRRVRDLDGSKSRYNLEIEG